MASLKEEYSERHIVTSFSWKNSSPAMASVLITIGVGRNHRSGENNGKENRISSGRIVLDTHVCLSESKVNRLGA